MKEKLKDILFPPRCAVCDDVIPADGRRVCGECARRLSYVESPRCYKCGKEIESPEEELCEDCAGSRRSYVKGFPVFNYMPPLSDALMALKYGGRQEYALFYGEEIYRAYGSEMKACGIDALVPVPLHPKKLLSRGYNQAELIAASLGKCLGVEVRNDILKRVSFTTPQKQLGNTEREKNLRKAFKAYDDIKDLPETVLLVDDIYTTGSTIEACTIACMEKGIKKVYYTSVAIGVSK